VPLGIILPASVIDVDLQPDPRWEHHARLDELTIFTQPAPGIARDATIPAYHASMKIANALCGICPCHFPVQKGAPVDQIHQQGKSDGDLKQGSKLLETWLPERGYAVESCCL